ncbi:hypothetical protein V8F06_005197 [Rhypophila decipiens]
MEKQVWVPRDPQQLTEFHFFPQLPAELRLHIYRLVIEPRIVHLKEHKRETFAEFKKRLEAQSVPTKLDFSLAYLSTTGAISTPTEYEQTTLEEYGFTSSRPDPQDLTWKGYPQLPALDRLWLLEQPYLAWWFWHESELYSKAPIPVLLHVCRESRYELMKLGYRKAFGNRTHEPMTWFHFDKDVLYLERHDCDELELHEKPRLLCQTYYNVGAIHPDDLFRVRRLALDDPGQSDENLRDLADLLNLFGWRVEELFYVDFLLDEAVLNDDTGYWAWCQDNPLPPFEAGVGFRGDVSPMSVVVYKAVMTCPRTPENQWVPEGPFMDMYQGWQDWEWIYGRTARAPWQMTICDDIDYIYEEATHPLRPPSPGQITENELTPARLANLNFLRKKLQPWKADGGAPFPMPQDWNYKGRDISKYWEGRVFRALRQCLKEGVDASVREGQDPDDDDDDDVSSWQPHDFGENEAGLHIEVRRIGNKGTRPFLYGEPHIKSGWTPDPDHFEFKAPVIKSVHLGTAWATQHLLDTKYLVTQMLPAIWHEFATNPSLRDESAMDVSG